MDCVLSREKLLVGTARSHSGMPCKPCAAPGCSAFLLERVPTGEPEVKREEFRKGCEFQQVCPQESLGGEMSDGSRSLPGGPSGAEGCS